MIDLQDYDPEANGCLTDFTLGFVAESEGCAIAIVLPSSNVNGATSDSFRVPKGDSDEGCEPEYCV